MQGTSYLSHFGLHNEPFSNAPVARFYYESEQHKQALTRLGFALAGMKGLCLVIGGIGTGKTTLARRLLDALPDSEYEAALLVSIYAGVDASWLLKRIAMQLGVVDPADEKLALLSQLYQRLIEIYQSGKRAVVLIDEAQMLATRELMEEFRGLLNLEVPERKLLSVVFFGLPEIDRILKLDPPLKQRVALRFRLEGLSREATEQYITHRLHLAGATEPLFTTAALDVIFDSTAGTPRLINALCDNALMEAYLAKQTQVDAPLVLSVVDSLGIDPKDYEESAADFSDAPAPSAPPAASPTKAAAEPAVARQSNAPGTPTLTQPVASTPAPAVKRPVAPAAKPAAAAHATAPVAAARPTAPKPASAAPKPAPVAPRPAPTPPQPPAALATPDDPQPTLVSQEEPLSPMLSAFGEDEDGLPKAPPAKPQPSIKKTTVNLDEIDSLLAQIKKPIG
jgi:general secretion pathway protein A